MACSVLGCVCGKYYFPQRFVMVLLSCLGLIIAFGQRVNLSLIITVMVKPGNKTVSHECEPENITTTTTNTTGSGGAPLFPPMTTLMARWIPKGERATVGGVTFAANSFGIIAGSAFSGLIKIFIGTWESVFYFWGLIGIIWYIFMMLYGYSEPSSHPHILPKEKEFIEANTVKREKKLKPAWGKVLIDPVVWGLIFGQYGHSWLIFFLATNMPKYYKDVLKFDMKRNTMVSSLPYLLQWVASVGSGWAGDWMIKKKGYSVAFIRKSYTTVASVFPSLCLLAMPYCGCQSTFVTILLCLSLFTMGPFYCGLKVNVIDVTINFSGIIMALVNGLGAIAGYVSPYIVGLVAPDNTLYQWKIVMWIIFIGASVTNILYIVMGKATRSKWDMLPEEWDEYKNKLDQEKAEKKAKALEKKAKQQEEKSKKQAGPST
ncbi:solute carrier family 17 [Holotrichia oblita]|uniref:Solute carrier family 17 n=1 Tax=Holotrichia oblita TaxID=644536 RepID=A0ACB9SV12_HOLOL|nr:solute carrier family 17 [Holotrichia oblita]